MTHEDPPVSTNLREAYFRLEKRVKELELRLNKTFVGVDLVAPGTEQTVVCTCNPKMKHREGCSFYWLTSSKKSKYTDLLLNLPVSKDYLLLDGNKERSACGTHAAKIGVKVMMRTVDGGKVKIYRVD